MVAPGGGGRTILCRGLVDFAVFPRLDAQERSQSLASGGLPGHRKSTRKLPRAAECPHPARPYPVPSTQQVRRSPSETLRSFARSRRWAHFSLGSRSHWIFGILQRPSIRVRNSSTIRSCSFGSSPARFSLSLLKNSRFRFAWFSRPRRTRAAIALLILVSTVSAYRSTCLATVDGSPTLYRGPALPRRFGSDLPGPAFRPRLGALACD